MSQIEMVRLEDLVPVNHTYRRFSSIWSFQYAKKHLKKLEKDNSYKGYGLLRLFKCLLLQFMEDLSDRELMRFIQENNVAKWFCGFSLTESTPDFTVFTRARQRIGSALLSKLFTDLRNQLKRQGLMNEVFSFVDASHLIAKAHLWEERDQAIKEKYEKLNNDILPQFAKDSEARIGCKGKDKYWFGYKKHVCVDMQSGLINKVAVTPANQTDTQGLKQICPEMGAIYADKGYCGMTAQCMAEKKKCHLAAIKRNNMRGKNKNLDRWISHIRAPYERVFAQQNKRIRYRGLVKNQFAALMEAIVFNLKRLQVLDPPGLKLA